MAHVSLLSGVCVSLCLIFGSSAKEGDLLDASQATEYLIRYGYLDGKFAGSPQNDVMGSKEFVASVKKFQKMYHLPISGALDEETKEGMMGDRCGVPDFDVEITSPRHKRSAERNKWWKTEVTYKIKHYSHRMPWRRQDEAVAKAFKIWEAVTSLRFTKSETAQGDIDIHFARRKHGDWVPFDGPGGVLAHAFFPIHGGDVHIDEDEPWTLGPRPTSRVKSKDFLQVLTHELGHALGLGHLTDRDSLMYPRYRGYDPDLKLHPSDIRAVQMLYPLGDRRTETPTAKPRRFSATTSATTSVTTSATTRTTRFSAITPTTTTLSTTRDTSPTSVATATTSSPSVSSTTATTTTSTTTPVRRSTSTRTAFTGNPCDVLQWDAVMTDGDGTTYFFKDDQYYSMTRATRSSAAARVPWSIREDWGGVPGRLSAAAVLTSGYTMLFKGDVFYLFQGKSRLGSGQVRYHLKGVPDTMDAAWVSPQTDKLHVAQANRYWRYNNEDDASYPRYIESLWRSAPRRLDAADVSPEGVVYFFSGTEYYMFDAAKKRADDIPRNTAADWFGCELRAKSLYDDTIVSSRKETVWVEETDDGKSDNIDIELILGNEIDFLSRTNSANSIHLHIALWGWLAVHYLL